MPTDHLIVRPATDDDLDTIGRLTASNRERLAGWSHRWWAKADGADDMHRLWLGHLLTSDAAPLRVVINDGQVVGCLTVQDQRTQWFIDDLAVDLDRRWPTVISAVIDQVPERPALTCVAARDDVRSRAFRSADTEVVSSYWIRSTSPESATSLPLDPAAAQAERAIHTFGGARLDPGVEGAIAFSTYAGSVIGSPSIGAPPVYDPGGTVAIVDLVTGTHLDALLLTTLGTSHARGDVLVNVVCATGDVALENALERTGFVRTVEVHRLP